MQMERINDLLGWVSGPTLTAGLFVPFRKVMKKIRFPDSSFLSFFPEEGGGW